MLLAKTKAIVSFTAADLCLCLHICKKIGFLIVWLIHVYLDITPNYMYFAVNTNSN